jgi:hypothetical protein
MTARSHERDEAAAEEKRRLLELLGDLEAIGSPPDGVQERDPFEFPERPGLWT